VRGKESDVESGVLSRQQLHLMFMKGSPCRICGQPGYPAHGPAIWRLSHAPESSSAQALSSAVAGGRKCLGKCHGTNETFRQIRCVSETKSERETQGERERKKERVPRNSSGSDEWCAWLQTNDLIPKVLFLTHPLRRALPLNKSWTPRAWSLEPAETYRETLLDSKETFRGKLLHELSFLQTQCL
jgi:hypothetical protein